MSLTLVLGPANSAKAGEVLGAFTAAAPRGALLVVPTAADAEHYTRELADDGAVLGSVSTFSGLTDEIARRAGYREPRASEVVRAQILRRAVAAADLRALRPSSLARGFAASVGDLVAELARAMVTPERFGRALEAWAAEDRRRAPHARDVAALYAAYRAELDRRGLVDRELFAWRALDALRAAPARWAAAPVFLYGFDELTALELDAVETLARVAGAPVTVSLTFEPGRVAFTARAGTVAALRPLADRIVELAALDDHYAAHAGGALHHLERWLFEPAVPRIDPGDSVRLLEAGGRRAEAELIAGEVSKLLRNGVPAEEIAIVCRVPGAGAGLLERVLEGYGIPAAAANEVAVAHTVAGRALLGLARCAWSEDASAADVLAVLRAPGIADPHDADAAELAMREEAAVTAAHALSLLGCPLPLPDPRLEPLDALDAAARTLLAAPAPRSAPLLVPGAELDARALAAILRALDDLRRLGDGVTAAELIGLLETLRVRESPRRDGAVQIADPLATRARRFRVVFVCGLNEGVFPAPASGDPFLGDELRREIARAGGLVLAPREDALGAERYLFYAAVSRATEQLVFSYISSDEEGNVALPSPFLADVAELFVPDWRERRSRRLLADVVWPVEGAPSEREHARALAAAGAATAGAVPEPARRLAPATLAVLRHNEVVSAGALEKFADCPVAWLVERELSPADFEPTPEALARGSFIHDVLEAVLSRLGEAVTPRTLPRALILLDEHLSELEPPGPAGRPAALRAAAQASVRADLRRYFEHEALQEVSWPARGLELRFGFDDDPESLPPLTLGEQGPAPVRMRGVIDRLDEAPDGSRRAIVRDYKSGSSRPAWTAARWSVDRQLQVALYMLAARRLMRLEPVAGLYQPLAGSDIRARGVFLEDEPVGEHLVGHDRRSAEELRELLEDAEGRALELTARLRSGELAPCPQTCSRDGCRHPGICRST